MSSVPQIILIGDFGPDPDDVKVLVCALVLHNAGKVNLLGVVANGGHQARQRARLALAVMDCLRVFVPVGVGEPGQAKDPAPYEYDLESYQAVDEARLVDGRRLIRDTLLNHAREKDVILQVQAGLMDVHELMKHDLDLVVGKVRRVNIMGGVDKEVLLAERRLVPDTANNNTFDMEAAEFVLRTCQAEGIPTSIISRDAVVTIPMSLAKRFADRGGSSVLKYLFACQEKGLVQLWANLHKGVLPPRCDTAWFFTTFCGVTRAEFEQRGYAARVGRDTPIAPFLEGDVKPYDVCSFMLILESGLEHIPSSILRQASTSLPTSSGKEVVHHLFITTETTPYSESDVCEFLSSMYEQVMNLELLATQQAGPGTTQRSAPKESLLARLCCACLPTRNRHSSSNSYKSF